MSNKLCTTLISLILLLNGQLSAQGIPEVHGNKGCRGIMPENSIPGFLKAVELGVDYIEMDVVISADKEIVISHDPWISSTLCQNPEGSPVEKSKEKDLNIFRMNYNDVQQYDCGTVFNSSFPNQQKLRTVKPSLKMAVRVIKQFASENKYHTPGFNIELRSNKSYYNTFTPEPAIFTDLVVNEVRRLGIEEQTILQSGDINVLEALHKIPGRKFRIAYVVEKGKKISKALEKLSFTPDIYSPLSTLLTAGDVKYLHEKNIKVIPWIINDPKDADQFKSWGVDGFITDYPDQLLLK